MIFSTQNQFNCFLIFIFFGIILGVLFSIQNILFLRKNEKFIKKIILDCIFYMFFSIFFIILINFFNFGKFSLTLLLAFILGFETSKRLLLKTVVFLQNKWYNVVNKFFKRSKKVCKTKE